MNPDLDMEACPTHSTLPPELASQRNYLTPVSQMNQISKGPLSCPLRYPKPPEAFSERSRTTSSPTQSSAMFSSNNATPIYSQGAYIAKPEKQLHHTIQLGDHQSQSHSSNRVSMAPPYMQNDAASGISKSANIRHTDTQSMHPQAWNTRQTVDWLHNKGISAHIINLFETNRIEGNALWDMDAYRVSLLGLQASSEDVNMLLEEIELLRDEYAPASPALPVYRD
ncbi:hypothetical protein BC829DRAFT_415332 [Chytridium lagenaria]|nr:hypothetical protein BC829DRAFT_415332 [Chytridium lagenaria]